MMTSSGIALHNTLVKRAIYEVRVQVPDIFVGLL